MNKVNKLLLRLMHANSYDLDPDPGDGGPWRFITALMDCWSACQVRQKSVVGNMYSLYLMQTKPNCILVHIACIAV